MNINKYELFQQQNQIELVRESGRRYYGDKIKLANPETISGFLKSDIVNAHRRANEHVWLLCFNTKNNLIGYFEVSSGTVNSSLCTPREIFLRALSVNAVYIVIAHNHPSGEVTPSNDDMKLTQRVKESGELLSIPLLDHIIISEEGFCSFRNKGLL